MRQPLIVIVGLSLVAGTASAAPSRPSPSAPKAAKVVVAPKVVEPGIDQSLVPVVCQVFAPAANGATPRAMTARISLASCTAEQRMNAVDVTSAADALPQLQAAIAPSVSMLQQVIAHGAARDQAMAWSQLADLHTSVVVRARAAIPPLGTAALADVARLVAAHAALEPLLAPDLTAARDATASGHQVAIGPQSPS